MAEYSKRPETWKDKSKMGYGKSREGHSKQMERHVGKALAEMGLC